MTQTTLFPREAAAASSRAFQTRPGDHRFFSASVSAVTILAGFSSTDAPKSVGVPALPWIIHLHAVVFTSWLVFYVTQTTLVLTGRTAVHRRLGIAGVVLAALMLIVGSATAITVTRLGDRGIPGVEFPDVEGFLLLNLAAVGVFAIRPRCRMIFPPQRADAQTPDADGDGERPGGSRRQPFAVRERETSCDWPDGSGVSSRARYTTS